MHLVFVCVTPVVTYVYCIQHGTIDTAWLAIWYSSIRLSNLKSPNLLHNIINSMHSCTTGLTSALIEVVAKNA